MHNQLSLYFIFCIMTSAFYPHGALTTSLLLLLLVIHQYFYYLLKVVPQNVEPSSYCTECDKMTTNSYVHCRQCNLCFPVTYFHWDIIENCVRKEDAQRYRNIVLLQLAGNLFCSLVQSVLYPPFLIIFLFTIVSCKSIMTKLQVNI